MQFLETSDTPRGALEHLQRHINTDTHIYTDPNKTVLGFKNKKQKEKLSDYIWKLIEEKKRLKQKLHSIKDEGEQQEIRKHYAEVDKKGARRDKKNHIEKRTETAASQGDPGPSRLLHNISKQLCGKIFSGNTKVKDENDIKSCIRKKIKSRDGRNTSVQYSMEKILKTQQILKWNNQQN